MIQNGLTAKVRNGTHKEKYLTIHPTCISDLIASTARIIVYFVVIV